jgi:preprotein translocase subunit SecG
MSSFWTNALFDVLLVIYVLDCCFMGLVIMMQRSKQEGLGAAFGGGFMQEFAGAQTSAVLVRATVYAAALFFILSISLARLSAHSAAMAQQGSSVQQELEKSAVPAPTNAAPLTTPAPTATNPPSTTGPTVAPVAPAPVVPANTPTH